MLHRSRLFLLLAAFVSFAIGGIDARASRIALVIGNQAYPEGPLEQALVDASGVADALTKLGFSVTHRPNLNKKDLEGEIAAFKAQAATLGPDDATFFYYAGHAAQDEGGNNFLIPVDVALSPEEVRSRGVPLLPLLTGMQGIPSKVNVVVLDACRSWFRGQAPPGSFRRGLSDLGRLKNLFLAMATSPNQTANEGTGTHGPYAARLIEGLNARSDLPLPALFDDVSSKVWFDTDNVQSPEFINGLADDVNYWAITNPANRPTGIAIKPKTYSRGWSAFLNSLDRDRLLEFTGQRPTIVDALLARRDLLVRYQVSTPIRLAHFLALSSYETGRYRYLYENVSFRESMLRGIFGRRFPDEETLRRYVGKPEMIANRVYANTRGNGDEASGDGWKFRGRGLIQLSGKYNYQRYGRMIEIDLLAAPELAADPEVAIALALAFWGEMGLGRHADGEDIESITRKVAGGPRTRPIPSLPARADELRRVKRTLWP